LGLVVSAICLWLALRQVPLDELLDAVQSVNYWWVSLAFAANIVSLVTRGFRWRVLLGERGSVAEYVWAHAIGGLLTNVFPLRAGEAGRVVIISRRLHLPIVQVAASVVLERAADMVIVLGMLATMLLLMDVPWPIAATGLALALAIGAALPCLGVLMLFGQRLTPGVEWITSRLPSRLGKIMLATWSHVLQAVQPLRDPLVGLQVAVWSVITWLIWIGMFWASIEAVVPGAQAIEAVFALTAIAIGISLPSSPGFIGVLQLVGQQALVTPFPERFTPVSALTVTLIFHAASYVTPLVLGAIGLARLGLSIRSVRASEAAIVAAP
jgi:uncharacterized membrane protein YbhN (UPF0104 family)